MQIILYSLNFAIGTISYGAADIGGSIFIHTFGAYFGLTIAFVLNQNPVNEKKPR
jgi:ammonium transporter Rh